MEDRDESVLAALVALEAEEDAAEQAAAEAFYALCAGDDGEDAYLNAAKS